MFDLTGKTALVTGSTQGIGFEIAKTLSQYGAKLFVHGAGSIEKCRAASEKIANSIPVCVDLLNENAAEELYEKTGAVDILVLNASIQYKKEWDKFSEKDYDEQMSCNLKSSYFLIKKYSQEMKNKKWGRIIAIGSVNQYNQHPELALYGITKAAQLKLIKNIAPFLAPFGVTANCVTPGAISTPRNEEAFSDKEFKKKIEQKIPCGYIGEPADISPAVLLLASNEGRYITGADIVIDGGMSL